MRVNDVSHITQRMVFLRVYEILVEANQSIIDRRDLDACAVDDSAGSNWASYDAGYPFCYFTGEVLGDLLEQPIIWQEQHLTVEAALRQMQPDLDHWLTPTVRELLINDFFSWKPHTLRVQELVDDVKQRVLDVVDAIHAVEKIQSMEVDSRLLHVHLGPEHKRRIYTGEIAHSLSYRRNGEYFEPVLYSVGAPISQKWFMHALIHGMWLVGQTDGHVSVDTGEGKDKALVVETPLYLV